MDKKTMQLLDRVKNEIANRMFAQERSADSKGNILYWKMRFAEDAAENIIHDIPIHTELFHFEFPNCQGYSFTLTKEDNDALVFILNTPEKQYIARDDIKGYKKTSYEMAEVMKKNGLYFAPAYNQAFELLLMRMIPGERISLNTGVELGCITNENNQVRLKKTFDGDIFHVTIDDIIFHVTIDDIRNAETYIINKKDPKSIQNLYGQAYDTRVQASNTRIRMGNEDGYSILQKIENHMQAKYSYFYNIGQCKLSAVKDEQYTVTWYDSDGKALKRQMVVTMFGWAKNSMAYLGNVDSYGWIKDTPQDKGELFKELNHYAFQRNSQAFLKAAFCYAKDNKEALFLSMSGLEEQINHSFDFVTYAFHVDEDGTEKILKFTYDQNEKKHNMPTKIEETTQQKFLEFFNAKYDERCQQIENAYEPMISKAVEEKIALRREVIAEVLRKQEEKGLSNPLGISKADLENTKASIRNLTTQLIQTGQAEETLRDFLEKD